MRTLVPALAALVLLQSAPAPPSQPAFADGLAQPVYPAADVIRHNVWIEVPNLDSDRDGRPDRVRVEVHRPAATDQGVRLPVVLNASPYAGGTLPYPKHDLNVELYVPGPSTGLRAGRSTRRAAPALLPPPPLPPYDGTDAPVREMRSSGYEAYFLPRGFIFAYANSLGTGASTGCPTIGGPEENLAMKAVIDWFNGAGRGVDAQGREAKATWTTGATTMIGTSYEGTLPIGAAVLGVAGLKAIVPIAGVSSYYDHRRSDGTVINSFPVQGTDADTLFDNILSRKHPEACQYMRDRIAYDEDRETGDYNAFWDARNYVKAVNTSFSAAVLIQHGLNDFNVKPRHAARLWAALQAHRVPAWIWWHQGGHGDRANTAAQAEWRDMLNRFWTHYLFGIDSGLTAVRKVRIEREDRQWEWADAWPDRHAAPVTLRLIPGHQDGAAGRVSLTTTAFAHPPEQSFVDDASVSADALASAAVSKHRLLFETGPLAAPLRFSGTPSVSLRLSFSAPAAIVSATLVDYKPSAAPLIVTRGWADPQNRESIERTVPVAPGKPYTIVFELQPHNYVFAAGSRVGLMVLSSDQLFTQHPPPGTTLTLHVADSTVTIPVVGGTAALTAAGIAGTQR